MSYVDSLKEHGCNTLYTVVDTSSGKFLCFTRLEDDVLYLCASDGNDVWRLELSEHSMENHKEVAGLNSEAFMVKMR